MRHDAVTERIREDAALYAIGAMEAEERARFEEHLGGGCAVCRAEVAAMGQVAAALAEAVPQVEPPAALRCRLLERVRRERAGGAAPTQIWKDWGPSVAAGPAFFKRRDEDDWRPTGSAGVHARQLFVDPEADRVTMLIRMLPGSSYPAHRHAGPEECYVVSGDLRVEDTVLRSGDYQRVAAGQVHPVQTTEEGCLLLIVSSLHDEILA